VCKSCAEGGQRCSSDNSEARRRRRRLSEALAANKQTERPKSYKSVLAADLTTIGSLMEAANSLGELLRANPRNSRVEQDKIDSELEIEVTQLGKAIASLAETRTGLDFEAIAEKYAKEEPFHTNETKRVFQSAKDEFDKALVALSDFEADNPSEKKEEKKTEILAHLKASADAARRKYDIAKDAHDKEISRYREYRAILLQVSEAYRNIISEIRPVGGSIDYLSASDPEAQEVIDSTVGKHFPSTWLQDSIDSQKPLYAVSDPGRAYYLHEKMFYDAKNLTNNPSDRVRSKVMTKYGLVPESQLENLESILGPNAKQLTGRPITIDGIVYQPVEAPILDVFDIKTHPSKDGLPIGPGWVYRQHFSLDDSGFVSTDKAWVREFNPRQVAIRSTVSVALNKTTIEGRGTAYHEMGHRMESVVSNGVIMRQSEAFLRRRTTDPTTGTREPLSAIYESEVGNPFITEVGRKDDFVNDYVGKEYASNEHREVFSVGIEAVFAGTMSALNGLDGRTKKDDDHKGFILGLLAAV